VVLLEVLMGLFKADDSLTIHVISSYVTAMLDLKACRRSSAQGNVPFAQRAGGTSFSWGEQIEEKHSLCSFTFSVDRKALYAKL